MVGAVVACLRSKGVSKRDCLFTEERRNSRWLRCYLVICRTFTQQTLLNDIVGCVSMPRFQRLQPGEQHSGRQHQSAGEPVVTRIQLAEKRHAGESSIL